MSSYWLVKNVFFIYEELNKYEKPYSSEKVQGFGHQQSKVLLMKSAAAEFTLVSWALGRLVPKYIEFAYCLLLFFFFSRVLAILIIFASISDLQKPVFLR